MLYCKTQLCTQVSLHVQPDRVADDRTILIQRCAVICYTCMSGLQQSVLVFRGTLTQMPSGVLRCKRVEHGVGELTHLVFAALSTAYFLVTTCKLRRQSMLKVCHMW